MIDLSNSTLINPQKNWKNEKELKTNQLRHHSSFDVGSPRVEYLTLARF
jgi:hypothetical protein